MPLLNFFETLLFRQLDLEGLELFEGTEFFKHFVLSELLNIGLFELQIDVFVLATLDLWNL